MKRLFLLSDPAILRVEPFADEPFADEPFAEEPCAAGLVAGWPESCRFDAIKSNDAEFIQYRNPVGSGPS